MSEFIIAELKIGYWRASKLHKDETQAENSRHGTTAASVRVKLCQAAHYTELQQAATAAYGVHKKLTLASDTDGMRLLPAVLELEHAKQMSECRARFVAAAQVCRDNYAADLQMSRIELNGLWRDDLWPAAAEHAASFAWDLRYMQCPADLSWQGWITSSVQAARAEAEARYVQALQAIRAAASKVAAGDKTRIHDSLSSNAFDAAGMAMAADLEPGNIEGLLELVPGIRDNPQDVLAAVDGILSQIGGVL
jgi:hypothetical protein